MKSARHEIRKEERNPGKLEVLLSRMAEPLPIELASTENVSPHGMRVRTNRPCELDSHVIVQSSEKGLWARGRVVYCQALSDGTFAIGLELVARTSEWIVR